MKPRYKVAYKMVTDMEWKCCHGYTGDDCSEGPSGGSGTQIATARPKPSRPGQTGTDTGHRGQSGGDGGWMFMFLLSLFLFLLFSPCLLHFSWELSSSYNISIIIFCLCSRARRQRQDAAAGGQDPEPNQGPPGPAVHTEGHERTLPGGDAQTGFQWWWHQGPSGRGPAGD